MLALRLDPVRLLIADDVGIGKTIEAALIARELLDRGEIQRLAVLCSPQLAPQWQSELLDKFHLHAEVVLPGTATRLERRCRPNESLFERYPHVIVSTDFIKSERRRSEFERTCAELVIVDEAHTCAGGWDGKGGRHQRYHLVSNLAADPARHLILVTATPHSGNESAFRSLLQLLDPAFAELPDDLTGRENEPLRRRLAAHLVQRRRGDIRHFLQAETPFPERESRETNYQLTPEYRRLFDRVLDYARETVKEVEGGESRQRQRIRWWSVLALLRALASSPAAAAATLRTRAGSADAETAEEADEIGRRSVLDQTDDDTSGALDFTPGGDPGEDETSSEDAGRTRRRLNEMAREAEKLHGDKDAKLKHAVEIIGDLVREGHHPIVFCRFIPTAEYVAEALRKKLRGVEVAAVTGLMPPEERESRVAELASAERRILVCTDCLSEGINLQDGFDAVVHYDLSWNPTRHEQREGRVDRYGQARPKVVTVTYFGADNRIDGIVLDVLIRKHNTIRNSLGVSVPVPVETEQVVEALLEGLILRGGNETQMLLFADAELKPKKEALHRRWDALEAREKRSRTMFAQESIKVDEVARELAAVRAAIGAGVDVATFTAEALQAHGAHVNTDPRTGTLDIDPAEIPRALKEALDVGQNRLKVCFDRTGGDGAVYLTRTHPIVEGLATWVMDTALDAQSPGVARRCGVIRTREVGKRTTLLLLRARYHIVRITDEAERPLLAEDCFLMGYSGSAENQHWLTGEEAETLLGAEPSANTPPEIAVDHLRRAIDGCATLRERLNEKVLQRGEELLDAHRRVRTAARITGVRYKVEPQLPGDLLGVYVFLPQGS